MLLYVTTLLLFVTDEAHATQSTMEIVKNITDHVFTGKSNILYFRDANLDSEIDHYIDSALRSTKNKTYVVVNSNLTYTTVNVFKCTAHVVLFTQGTEPKNFMKHISDHILGENIRSLIIIEGERNHIEQFSEWYPLGAEIILITIETEEESHDLRIFQRSPNFNICVYKLWQQEKSLCATNTQKVELKEFFEGKSWRPIPKQVFTVQSFNCPPFVDFDEHKQKYSGIEYNILQEVTKNWHVNLIIANDSSLKSKWNFAVDALLEGKVDMAMCSLWLNTMVDLLPNITITYPFLDTCVTLLVPKPQVVPDIFYVFQPVQFTLWISFVFLVPVMSLIIRVFTKKFVIFDVIRILTIGSLARPITSKQRVLRYILVSFSLTSLLFSTAYSAGFISLLTYPRLIKPILYLEDVVNMNVKIDTEIPDVALLVNFFKKFENPNIRKMADLLVSSTLDEYKTLDTKDFARIVKLIGKKCVTDTDNYDNYKKTHLRLLKECLFESYSTFALRQYSMYSSFFNKMLLRLNEHGFIAHWYQQSTVHPRFNYMNNFFSSYVEDNFEHAAFKASKLEGAFFVLGIGLALALAAFVYEIQKSASSRLIKPYYG